ncbi:MAG: MBOAT family protein [Verrucomicrobia bacterium]|nr:MBOAT family protein [Verrucomicrobiota bacterium]
MHFNSYEFIFIYLPVVLVSFFWLAKLHRKMALIALTLASLFFYGWWNSSHLALLLLSIICNYLIGSYLCKNRSVWVVTAALLANVGVLIGYKCLHAFSGIILPLGISFFTFTQIAYLVDCYRGQVCDKNFMHYCLFITYFPHLIAGPLLHHKEIMPQFKSAAMFTIKAKNMAEGIFLFVIGLFKKVILADALSFAVAPIFKAACAQEASISCAEAFTATAGFSLQLYFDFSGYSDMAVGVSRMFGITLPINFNSPYKAVNIADFWRRWHISLSQYLKEYIYIPLGGNRCGKIRQSLNLLTTMLLGGMWHGFGWTYAMWGLLHGLFLVVCHMWTAFRQRFFPSLKIPGGRFFAQAITLCAVCVGWVYFRADSIVSAHNILSGFFQPLGAFDELLVMVGAIVALFAAVLTLPNSMELAANFKVFRPVGAVITALMFVYALIHFHKVSEFLYWQF